MFIVFIHFFYFTFVQILWNLLIGFACVVHVHVYFMCWATPEETFSEDTLFIFSGSEILKIFLILNILLVAAKLLVPSNLYKILETI